MNSEYLWTKTNKDQVTTIGLTDEAISKLGEIKYLDLPEIDEEVKEGNSFLSLESKKTVFDLTAPISGKVVEVNESAEDDPEKFSKVDSSNRWFIKVK